MNEISIINKSTLLGREINVYGSAENPLFKAKDVAGWLDIQNVSDMIKNIDPEEKVLDSIYTLGGNQEAWLVTEDGLYEILMQSRKPIAKQFKKGVKEILKTIRHTGGYIATNGDETDDQIFAKAILIAQEKIKNRDKVIKELQDRRQQDAPLVTFANAIIGSQKSCLIGELAKILTQNGYKIGQNRLFEWLRTNGYLGSKGERYNIPNQQYIEKGIFELKKGIRSGNDGVIVNTITTKVTPKGQQYFILKFLHS